MNAHGKYYAGIDLGNGFTTICIVEVFLDGRCRIVRDEPIPEEIEAHVMAIREYYDEII
jgi:hypothetical protein